MAGCDTVGGSGVADPVLDAVGEGSMGGSDGERGSRPMATLDRRAFSSSRTVKLRRHACLSPVE